MKPNDNYVTSSPSAQNAVDLFAGAWLSKLPDGTAETGAEVPLFNDGRINWLIAHRGRFEGQTVLELGPLEGGHTYMLEKAGAEVLGIEANTTAYLKALVAKEATGMTRARFLLGDFDRYLAETDRRFDMILACGVLYHMTDPLVTLTNVMRLTDEIFIWSHFFDDAAMPVGDPRRQPFTGETQVREYDGRRLTYHLRSYGDTTTQVKFIGGAMPGSVWLDRDETRALLEAEGFAVHVEFAHDDHPHGPAACLYAKR
jgi:hypothetical protein